MAYTEIMQQRDSKMAIKFLTKSSGYRICLWDNKVKTQYKNRFQCSSPFQQQYNGRNTNSCKTTKYNHSLKEIK